MSLPFLNAAPGYDEELRNSVFFERGLPGSDQQGGTHRDQDDAIDPSSKYSHLVLCHLGGLVASGMSPMVPVRAFIVDRYRVGLTDRR
jgi:hypothetical protein